MSRTYSEAFLIELYKANPNRAGTALALACVKANLPTKVCCPPKAWHQLKRILKIWLGESSIKQKGG